MKVLGSGCVWYWIVKTEINKQTKTTQKKVSLGESGQPNPKKGVSYSVAGQESNAPQAGRDKSQRRSQAGQEVPLGLSHQQAWWTLLTSGWRGLPRLWQVTKVKGSKGRQFSENKAY